MDNYHLPFGVDGCRYEYAQNGSKLWNFDDLKASKAPYEVKVVALRTGVSWGYADAWFGRSWSEAKRIEIPRVVYHVFYFGEDPKKQLDNMWRIIGDDWDNAHDRICIDLEVEGHNDMYTCTRTTEKILQSLRSTTFRYPICYARAEWVNRCLAIGDLPSDLNWWLAQYREKVKFPLVYTPEYVCPPTLPKGVKRWFMHQTSQYMPTIGGGGSKFMDYNRFNGTDEELQTYFGYQVEAEEPIDDIENRVSNLEQRVTKLEATL
jgi:GH25 family lysozyme M1 (1,4-beta-N-acetylmuramidase)